MGRVHSTANPVKFRGMIAGFLGGLALFLAASGCSKRDIGNGNDRPPDDANSIEPPPERAHTQSPVKTPPARDEPALIVPLDQDAFFMGTRARGQRFCIIADASNSMQGAPLNQLKKEILQTLDGLKPTSSFYVILFNATDIPMPFPSWLRASKENVDKVRPWVQDVSLKLYTKPTSAFERAFKLTPKPDVIFFMTDGFLQGFSPEKVTRLNAAEPKVIVHTIMFTKKKVENNPGKQFINANAQLRAIAEGNGGTFRHVSHK